MSLNPFRRPIRVDEVPLDRIAGIVQDLLDTLGVELIVEETPDYSAYSLREVSGGLMDRISSIESKLGRYI